MFKALRITILLFILFMVATGTWLTQLRSTDWNNSLWLKIYPINGDGSDVSETYIAGLKVDAFSGIEEFLAREVRRYGHELERPVRIELGEPIPEQPPPIADSGSVLSIALWSLRMRWWVSAVTGDQDRIDPDVRIFVRYHSPQHSLPLENSVGVQKGMFGIVNAYSSRRHAGRNNVVIAHEFLHTLGATDKYDAATAMPLAPRGVGLTISELNQVTGLPEGTIKARLHRARKKLGRLLSNDPVAAPRLKVVGGRENEL